MTLVPVCAQCGRQYEPNTGRGRKSRYCDDCRKDRSKVRAAVRQFMVMSASMIEVSMMVGPTMARMRMEVTERQEGRCGDCSRRRRLFMIDSGEKVVGACIDCFTRRVHDGDKEDTEGVPGGRGRPGERHAARPRAGAR